MSALRLAPSPRSTQVHDDRRKRWEFWIRLVWSAEFARLGHGRFDSRAMLSPVPCSRCRQPFRHCPAFAIGGPLGLCLDCVVDDDADTRLRRQLNEAAATIDVAHFAASVRRSLSAGAARQRRRQETRP